MTLKRGLIYGVVTAGVMVVVGLVGAITAIWIEGPDSARLAGTAFAIGLPGLLIGAVCVLALDEHWNDL